MKKEVSNKKSRMIIIGSICLVIAILLIAYICVSQYYKEHFYAKTFINGMDCSNLTAEEAKSRISEGVNSYILNVKERNGKTEKIAGSDIDLKCTFDQDMNHVLDKQSAYSWISNTWKENKVENPYQLTYDESKLTDVINKMNCLKKENQVEPTNAKISKVNDSKGFEIKKEKQGCKVEKDKLAKTIQKAIKDMESEVSIEKEKCYKNPKVTSNDASLTKTMEEINKYMSTKVTLKLDNKSEVFDGTKIGSAIKVSKSGKVSIDKNKIHDYVLSLAKKYNGVPESRNFKTSYGTKVNVKGGDLGWFLDKAKQEEKLLESIKNGEQKEEELIGTSQSVKPGTEGIGDTYVEINLTKQHLFYYKNGKLIIETDIVSGSPLPDRGVTPTGCYCIRWMERDRLLNGPTWKNVHVNNWMSFISEEGIGIHDAKWQYGQFGGTRYLTEHGSHGCINVSIPAAETIYSNIEPGVPVIVYKDI